ncbi:Uncharacterised protein [Streptococcus pneumoniae]|nr:Uncharacterised protein [Streptococcus pneumoniae]
MPIASCFLVTFGCTLPISLSAVFLIASTIGVVLTVLMSFKARFNKLLTLSTASCFSSLVAPGVALILVIASFALLVTAFLASVLTCVEGWTFPISCSPLFLASVTC